MDPEDKEMLGKILELSQKNSKILNAIQKSMFWGRVFRYLYWIIIVGVAIGAYYFIDPYIDQVLQIYGGVKGGVNSIFQ